ncbi:MAG: signal peptide peptidase SppA [Chitinophagales bacterium]|nr:signal peptide peptidase SppA [Chitinophagales bacterium]MDW8273857.1 signal peptide peptidase SppA [Chitinophagales bacterium]
MRQFIKFTLATITGLIIFFFLLIFILAGLAAAGAKKPMAVPANSILELNLNYDIPEKTHSDPLQDFDFSTLKPRKAVGLVQILKSIDQAASDKNIKGIYLPMGINMNGFATLEAIRNKLIEFKKSGKFIYAYGVVVSQKSYYVSSVADKIFLDPNGYLELRGLGVQITYFKNALDKAGVEIQEFHVGDFKSAIEPFIRTNMSDANREQLKTILSGLQQHMIYNITASRKISPETFKIILDSLKATNAESCKSLALVDDMLYYDQVLEKLKDKTGVKTTKDLEWVKLEKYAAIAENNTTKSSDNKVAVVFLEGEIVDGEGDETQIGGETASKLIRKLREDDKIKAIVMRVNSPGGSAIASDLIWREVTLAKKKKPVIASFGDVAASGGYYISCAADRIFVQPNTITGSIGVFGLVPNFKKLLNDKIGVTSDEVEVAQHANFGGGLKPLDDFESMVVKNEVERIYTTFRQRVADGRKADISAIEAVAQGRVWTGSQAIEKKLADEVGGLDDAIAYVSKQNGLKDYSVVYYPKEKSFAEKIAEGFENIKLKWVKSYLGAQYEVFCLIQRIQAMHPIQCRLPFEYDMLM